MAGEESFWTSLTVFVVVFPSLLVLISLMKVLKRGHGLPGPVGLPFLGYLPFLTDKPHLQLAELRKTYGDIYRVQLGSKPVVVLNSSKAIKEVLNKPEFLGRPDQSLFFVVPIESPFFASGKLWSEHRKFGHRATKDYADRMMQEHVEEEICCFIKTIESEAGRPCNVTQVLTSSISNNISCLLFGRRYDYGDPEKERLDRLMQKAVQEMGQTSVVVFFPWLKRIPFIWKVLKIEGIRDVFQFLRSKMRSEIAEHKKRSNMEGAKDFIDHYFCVMAERPNEDSKTKSSERLLADAAISLYGAGSDTTKNTVSWCLHTMAAFPAVQKKVREEIREVVGLKCLPTVADQMNLPFTRAVLMEVQRWQTAVPLGILRMTTEDAVVRGYHVSRGTYVITNLWAVHHDPDCWKTPNDFVPQRFLSPDGKSILRSEHYMPFSYGKRSCLSEGLASSLVFLYFTCILQRFSIEFPEGHKPDFEGIFNITYQPKPYKLCFLSHHE